MDAMPRKPAPKPDNPEQFKRFQQTAREVGADKQGEAFDRVFERVVRPKQPPADKAKRSAKR
jgi:hypothetical protein